MSVIEDERHAEVQEGRFSKRQDAISELKNRAKISWDEHPNVAPCTNWSNCGRSYELIEYDDSTMPWTELSRGLALEISADGVRWHLPDAEILNSWYRIGYSVTNLEPEWVQIEGKERDQILQSLYGVGPEKAIGYLPLYTLREFLQIDPREMADQVALRGLTTAIFNVEQCRIKSGAIYVYDRHELKKLLNASASSLTQYGLPLDPDHFVKEIAATWYEPEHPVYPIISAAFGE